MTLDELRKKVHVYNYYIESERTARIFYYFEGKQCSITYYSNRFYQELIRMSSIETEEEFNRYELSQWDALNLAIRHEYARIIDNEISLLG